MRPMFIAAALAFAASAAVAQGYGYGPGMGYGPGWGRGPGAPYALAALDLTKEQSDKIRAIRDEERRKHWDVRDQMRAEMFKLRQMPDVDSPAYAEQAKKVADLREQMFTSREETRSRIEAVLTPEQRKQLR